MVRCSSTFVFTITISAYCASYEHGLDEWTAWSQVRMEILLSWGQPLIESSIICAEIEQGFFASEPLLASSNRHAKFPQN
jgi:hypothetical protein